MKKLRARRRKVIRVESEETQDYVSGANYMNLEEAKEKSFVPSAISVPQKPLFSGDELSAGTGPSASGSLRRWWKER